MKYFFLTMVVMLLAMGFFSVGCEEKHEPSISEYPYRARVWYSDRFFKSYELIDGRIVIYDSISWEGKDWSEPTTIILSKEDSVKIVERQ